MKRSQIFFLVFILIFIFFVYIKFFYNPKKSEFFNYNPLTNKTENINPNKEVLVLPEELNEENDTNFVMYNYIIRGYFEKYNSSNNKITIKAELLNNNQQRLLTGTITDKTVFACWPKTLFDRGKNKEIPTHTLTFPLNSPDENLHINQEKILEKIDFNSLNLNNYLIIQLENKISSEKANNIKKIIILKPC